MRPTPSAAALGAALAAASLAAGLIGGTVVIAVPPSAAADLPRHNLRVDVKEIDSANRFVLYGKVDTYPDGHIRLVRSVSGGPYHRVKKLPTSDNGRFRARVYQSGTKVTCFKVVVPATDANRRTVSKGAPCIKSY